MIVLCTDVSEESRPAGRQSPASFPPVLPDLWGQEVQERPESGQLVGKLPGLG